MIKNKDKMSITPIKVGVRFIFLVVALGMICAVVTYPERHKNFMSGCANDGFSKTECTVMWENMNRVED